MESIVPKVKTVRLIGFDDQAVAPATASGVADFELQSQPSGTHQVIRAILRACKAATVIHFRVDLEERNLCDNAMIARMLA